ncbi:MAG TPA: tyrosine-type recombinase/integrase, partial [Thermotogota bacterium]|nr:tyrosine-type recombinase/integrase [Thermotogota bacterium]
DFFGEATPEKVEAFLSLATVDMNYQVTLFKSRLISEGKSEATVNRRLAAVKSLVRFSRMIGATSGEVGVSGEKVKTYRDTKGVGTDGMKDILTVIDRSTSRGKRDYAVMRLFWENALRRGEIEKLDLSDFDGTRLAVLGKGRGTQKEWIELSPKAIDALNEWIDVRGSQPGALFVSLDNRTAGHRLTGKSLERIVAGYAKAAGIERKVSPHRLRHTAITAALETLNGDTRAAQTFSRHAKLETLMIYDDHRKNYQGKATSALSALI